MPDRPSLNEREAEAREALVRLATAMLDGKLSYFEGAVEVLGLKSEVGGVPESDPHFDAFVVIESETDHLPLRAQRHLWNDEKLDKIQPEFEHIEKWAASFASVACLGLIERFGGVAQNS